MNEYIVAYHKRDKVKVRAFNEFERAREIYEDVSSHWAKVLFEKRRGSVVRIYGADYFVQLCMDVIDEIGSFLPTGSYIKTSKRVEVNYNTKRREFNGRAKCRTRNGNWRDNEFTFSQGDTFENIDGHMKRLT